MSCRDANHRLNIPSTAIHAVAIKSFDCRLSIATCEADSLNPVVVFNYSLLNKDDMLTTLHYDNLR